ncbi:MAG: DPP IV N-terminal domain-containing protein, partial [Syntrophobacterales bacterium]|nr:DPP IV N-terminal domain-containing protein [Syntrophobacterales bacterium]
IDSPGFRKFPLAIADFRQLEGNDLSNLSRWFPDEMARYLEMTNYFQIRGRRSFLESPGGHEPFRTDFRDWTAIGVDYLVKGVFTVRGTELLAEIRVFDTVKAAEIFRRTYNAPGGNRQSLVRKIAGDVLHALTGAQPLFDSRIFFTRRTSQGSEIFSVKFDGSDLTKLTSENALVLLPQLSPNGRYLSYTSYRSGTPAVYIKDLQDRTTRRIAAHDGLNLAGPWSPDGRKMLLTLSKDGNEEIYTIDVPSGSLTRLTRNFAIDISPSWSPDGRKISFVSNRSGAPQIYVMNADGSGVTRLSYDGNYNTSPAWSPKGDKIAYESRTSQGFQVFTVTLQGDNARQATSSGDGIHEKPAWSPDGRYLAVVAKKGKRYRILVIDLIGSGVRSVYESDSNCSGLSWAR